METMYIAISIVALALIVVLLLISRKKGTQPRKLSNLATLGMGLVVFGIIFVNIDKWIGYSFMGAGVTLSVIDFFRNLKKNKGIILLKVI